MMSVITHFATVRRTLLASIKFKLLIRESHAFR